MRRGRRSYASYKKPRAKKIRPIVRVKEKVLAKPGKCSACRGRFAPGETVVIVSIKRKVYHKATCVPANAGALPTAAGGPLVNTPTAVVGALSANWSVGEAKLVAIMAMENAMVAIAKSKGAAITDEMEKAFDRFMKLKAMALRPGSDNEGDQAVKQSLITILKTFF